MRGVEPPTDADEGSMGASDQEQDPDMSNSSSDVVSLKLLDFFELFLNTEYFFLFFLDKPYNFST